MPFSKLTVEVPLTALEDISRKVEVKEREHSALTGTLSPLTDEEKSHHGGRRVIRASSAHGGRHFESLFSNKNMSSASDDAHSWSVHDGQFFAKAVGIGAPRAPQERVFVSGVSVRQASAVLPPMSLLNRRQAKEMRINTDGLAKLAGRNAKLLAASVSSPAVPSMHAFGGRIVNISDFKLHLGSSQYVLGMGSFSCVHLGERCCDGTQVAIKVFHHPVSRGASSPSNSRHGGRAWVTMQADSDTSNRRSKDPRMRKEEEFALHDALCFKREVKLLADAKLSHPRILQYLGHGFVEIEDGLLAGFIVTEFVPGTDLYSLLERASKPSVNRRRHTLGPAEPASAVDIASALRWAKDLASAVAHLHQHHVIHRDIKETNACAHRPQTPCRRRSAAATPSRCARRSTSVLTRAWAASSDSSHDFAGGHLLREITRRAPGPWPCNSPSRQRDLLRQQPRRPGRQQRHHHQV